MLTAFSHVSIVVPDLEAAAERVEHDDADSAVTTLRAEGVRILGDGKPQHNVGGERIAFIHPGDFLGCLVELEEHSPLG